MIDSRQDARYCTLLEDVNHSKNSCYKKVNIKALNTLTIKNKKRFCFAMSYIVTLSLDLPLPYFTLFLFSLSVALGYVLEIKHSVRRLFLKFLI